MNKTQNRSLTANRIAYAFFVAFLSFSSFAYSSILDTCLLRSYGGPGNEFAYSMAAMSDSGVVLAGITNYYGSGGNSVYMVRTDKNGIRRWSKVLGGSAIDQCNSVQVTGDTGVFLIGYTNSFGQGGYDGMIIKTDTGGSELWEKSYGGSDWDFFDGGYLLPDGSIIACGRTYSNGAAQCDAYAVCVDTDGNELWHIQLGSQYDDAFNDVVLQGGYLFFVGTTHLSGGNDKSGYVVKTDLSGNVITELQPSVPGTCELKAITAYNNEVVMTGSSMNPDSTHSNGWMVRMDTSCSIIWNRIFGDFRESYFNDVIAVSSNQLVFIGQNVGGGFGGKTMLMIRTDVNGDWQAGHNFGGSSDEEGYCLIELPGHRLAGCGYTTSWGFGNEDALLFILPYDSLQMDYYYNGVYFFENLSPISVSETTRNPVIVSPNPAHGMISFSGIDISLVKSISIIPVDGREMLEISKRRIGNGIDVSDFTNGMYFYRLATAAGTYVGKFILE